MSNEDEIKKINNPLIRGETPIYYLVNKEKLENLKINSVAQDIAMLFSSIFIGAFVSYTNILFLLSGLVCLGFAVFFYIQRDQFINKLKKSREVKSFESHIEKGKKLVIIKSVYGTLPDKIIDNTEYLNQKILNNRLLLPILNSTMSLLQTDPDPHVKKALKIKYKFAGEVIQKTHWENETIDIP